MDDQNQNRRPIAQRSAEWAQKTAALLAATSITPNQISVISVGFAAIGAAFLVWDVSSWGLLGCALAIQARLVCNLLDGMVAVEGGKRSPLGQLYNEFPDRAADSLLIIALGVSVGLNWLGWLGALLAALTAYIRVFGGSLGLPQDFRGPMAKQHRMAVMTLGCLLAIPVQGLSGWSYPLIGASVIIAAGSLLTCITRTRALAQQLQKRSIPS